MKTNDDASFETAPLSQTGEPVLIKHTAESENWSDVARARAFVEPLLQGVPLLSGEDALAHADQMCHILKSFKSSESLQAAAYLIYAVEHIQKPKEVLGKAFDGLMADLVIDTHRLIQVQAAARQSTHKGEINGAKQVESARKMLLAFSRDLRGVMLRLSSRLQTLRYATENKTTLPKNMAEETLYVFAPLANRLGIWQLKWQLEDLSFRYLQPETYREIASLLAEKRVEREDYIEKTIFHFQKMLGELGIQAYVSGRPKHIYSIWKKMTQKSLNFSEMYDIRAFRIIVSTVEECYRVLDWVNENFESLPEEFDDYIAKPKINGYRSLHMIVKDHSPRGKGKALEIQIRTQEMHEQAERGGAAHWAYKEAGVKGYTGVVADSDYDTRIALLRQLLAWGRDLSEEGEGLFDDHIYVLTPDAALLELPKNSTPLDFAYAVHTELGHRCRGAKLDGQMVPLDTKLKNGQTVEIITIKEGGPSRDWLKAEAGYLASSRAKAKVRAWFNAQAAHEVIAKGREQVEKLLQREGKTAVKLESLAAQLGFKSADNLFEVVGKDEYSLRNIEIYFKPVEKSGDEQKDLLEISPQRKSGKKAGDKNGILVVGVDSLLTQLAKCCRPAPPDEIVGYVTRGKGISIHRKGCPNVAELISRDSGRLIEVEWDEEQISKRGDNANFAVDILLKVKQRVGLLRDISEVMSKEKMNIISVNTYSGKSKQQAVLDMVFTVEIIDSKELAKSLRVLANVEGVISAERR